MLQGNSIPDPRSEKERELVDSKLSRYDAMLDYVAMMSGVELPDGQDGDLEPGEEVLDGAGQDG